MKIFDLINVYIYVIKNKKYYMCLNKKMIIMFIKKREVRSKKIEKGCV